MIMFYVSFEHDKYIQYRPVKNYKNINYTSSIANLQTSQCKDVENANYAWKLFSYYLEEVRSCPSENKES